MKFLIGLCLTVSIFASPIEERERSAETPVYPVVLLGSGIGSLTSSLYLARAGLQPVVIAGKNPGGLLTQSHAVGNWPGEMEIDGVALTDKVRAQAEENGAQFLNEEVVGVDFSRRPFAIQTRSVGKGGELRERRAEAVIIAMGTQPNFLGVPGESAYWGHGVTNCAICDGSLYRGQVVGVVGGGDAAVLEALYLSNIAKEVHLFVRKDALKAIEEKRVQVLLSKPNVKILYNTVVEGIKGDGAKLKAVALRTSGGGKVDFPLDGLFLAIGSRPNSNVFQNILKLDERGYIALAKDQQTSIEGVYAIGDIVDPIYKQAISAAGDGAKAALQAQQYLSDRSDGLIAKRKVQTIEGVLTNQAKPSAAEVFSPRQGNARAAKHPLPTLQVIEISSLEQFERELKSSEVPVIVDFYASWCRPCKRISPMIEHSAHQLSGKVKFLKVNAEKFFNLTQSYDVQAMPTLLLFNHSGKVIERKVGADQIADFLKLLESRSN